MTIEFNSVSKIFANSGSTRVLDDVNLVIEDNEFFTLLGPSGCGKTTLLRMIAGFEHPTSGSITLFGDPLEATPPNARPVNTVFQHYALFPHQTVEQNVSFGLKMLRRPAAEIKVDVERVLDLVQLGDLARRLPHQLSGGQQQRVALARALVTRPRALLLDEPLSALDSKLRDEMRVELKTLQREMGITFVFVTHDQGEALAMSDRIAVLSGGRIQQVGSPDEIYDRPANRFVAQFVGDTNFLEGTVFCGPGRESVFRTSAGAIIPIADTSYQENQCATLAFIRPEKLHLSSYADAEASGRKGLRGVVSNKLYLGTDTVYSIDLDGGETLRAQNPEHERSGKPFRDWRPGQCQRRAQRV
ncbi:ABC transporter ATP-binding protein [Hoeflea sp. G2-23]|uniref:Spermidine/putrescine import ATP-binding protein PotA n=1 Tax=Hoeflea algicola TaxID=2983763 RepID=A0ABT3ZER6_9HYPH|nr:ABC transporter ATP-binding protein [Hoeflea algicola]MCY0150138.1 ABC transporter ATP-binding protein [Hoeflea algicola]